ncbi:MAG TPA: hypothetical protein VEH52_08600 [Gaiellaceae bacterium]|nr:hypothetical protein [Gaiellaceae bacterium]
MKRRVHSSKNNLDWIVRVVWSPEAIRPIGVRQVYSGSVGRGANRTGAFGIVFSLVLFLILVIPTVIVVLPLRYAGVMPWEVEAVARPWGRRGPATVMRWRVKGRSEVRRVVDEVAAALERGEDQPRIAGARRDV